MRRTLAILSLLLTAVLLAAVVRMFFVTQYTVTSAGTPGLMPGDRVLVGRLAYGLRLPGDRWWGACRWGHGTVRKGDYSAFYDPAAYGPEDRRAVRVGQIVAVPGDTLWVDPVRRGLLPGRTTTDARPIPVPGAGTTVNVTPWNARLLWNTLRRHEGLHVVLVADTALRFDGRLLRGVRFSQDYYWADGSEAYGFVPASSLVGRVFCVSYSFDPNQPFGRSWRRDRCFLLIE